MPEFIAALAIFVLAALGLAAGMLCGRPGLRGGCHGGGGPQEDAGGDHPDEGCGRPGCCSSVPQRPQQKPLVQLDASGPSKDG